MFELSVIGSTGCNSLLAGGRMVKGVGERGPLSRRPGCGIVDLQEDGGRELVDSQP